MDIDINIYHHRLDINHHHHLVVDTLEDSRDTDEECWLECLHVLEEELQVARVESDLSTAA